MFRSFRAVCHTGVKEGGGLELSSELPIGIVIGAVCVTGVEGGGGLELFIHAGR